MNTTLSKTLLLVLCCSLPAAAAQEALQSLSSGTYELGAGYVSDDAYRFGRYNGLQNQGAYAVGDLAAKSYREDGLYWRARGTRLGLESRYLRLEGGFQGRQTFFIEYDELPNNDSDSANTPFQGVGNANLTLPAGFNINQNPGTSLHAFDIETDRTRLGLGASFVTRSPWTLDIRYHHDNRQGTGRIGGANVNSGGSGGGGHGGGHGGGGGGNGLLANTTATLMPKPIDYETNLMDVTLHYVKDNAQFDINYHLSLFDNDNRTLSWQDPFNPAIFSSQALAPDNEFHQLRLTGGYTLPHRSHLSGTLAIGRMTQNADFEPYALAPAAALPRSSLDGEVWLTTAQLALRSRPLRRLRLDAAYRYDERNSDTPVDSYTFVGQGPVGGQAVENNPLSYQRSRVDLGANYRLRSNMSLRGGYRFDRMSRDYRDTERKRTDENTLFAKWKLQPHALLDLALHAEAGWRDGSQYRVPVGENPALRKYNLADRDRTRIGTTVDFLPGETLSVTAAADYTRDDYDNSEIGLTEATQPAYRLDVAWLPGKNTSTYAYYSYEKIRSRQAGSEAGTASADWRADFDDTVNSFGAGASINRIRGKWDIGTDLVYTTATGDIDMQNLVPGTTVTPYPDLKTTLTSIKLWTLYRYRKDTAFRLSYGYEDYDADNWAVDNLQENSVPNLLLLGEDSGDYSVHVITATVIFQF